MAYKMIAPATDWFFVQKSAPGRDVSDVSDFNPVILRIAVWAVDENDDVVGLADWQWGKKLTPPATGLHGCYQHISRFSKFELDKLAEKESAFLTRPRVAYS